MKHWPACQSQTAAYLDRITMPQPREELSDRSLAGVLGASRDRTDPTDSSRGLVMTVLGEYVLSTTGDAWTQTIVGAMELVGVRDKTTRQTLARLHEKGRLHKERVGRQTRWSLTPPTRTLLGTGAEQIYGFGQTTRDWDGRWAILLASVPEADRNTRYRMGVQLRWAGFGTPGQGVWLSPWTSREAEAARALGELGVSATSFRGEISELGDGAQLARQAWDLQKLHDGYERFLIETEELADVVEPAEALAALTTLVHRWRQFPFADPDLPAELLPESWPREVAALRFAQLRSQLRPAASRWWINAENTHSPRS